MKEHRREKQLGLASAVGCDGFIRSSTNRAGLRPEGSSNNHSLSAEAGASAVSLPGDVCEAGMLTAVSWVEVHFSTECQAVAEVLDLVHSE